KRDGVVAAALGPGGRRLATIHAVPGGAQAASEVVVWDVESGAPVGGPLKSEAPVLAASFRPDGKQLVTGSQDGTARVWDLGSGRPALDLENQHGAVRHVAFSPDGKKLLMACDGRPASPTTAGTPGAPGEDALR